MILRSKSLKIFSERYLGSEMERNGKILVVDDEEKNLLIMESLLAPKGHELSFATDGAEAIKKLNENPPDLILLDVMLPDMDGFKVCKILKSNEATRLIPVILVTSLYEISDKIKGLESDADDFLSKPVNKHELMARVRSCLRIKALNDRLERSESVLFAFVQAVEAKDPYTLGHSQRVAKYAMDLGLLSGLVPNKILELKQGGLLHDIGKIGVPDAVLSKEGPLTDEEFELIKEHTIIGEKICEPLHSLGEILPLIRGHHERLDGSGYPDGLKGSEISLSLQIMGIADTFDALSSNRPYRKSMPLEKVDLIFREEVDKGKFDRDLVEMSRRRFPYWLEDLSRVKVPGVRETMGYLAE